MLNRNLLIIALTLGVCACSRNVPSNEGLGPTVTTHAWDRSQTGALSGTESELVEARVAVESVDLNKRLITVRNYQDMLDTYTVSSAVKRLNDIKPGDRIVLSFNRAMAFEVRKPTPAEIANPTMLAAELQRNPIQLPPGMEAGAVKHTIVTVEEIDFKTKSVTLKLPEGKKVTTYARNPENLSRIKVGDTVAVTYGEAFVIDVKPIA